MPISSELIGNKMNYLSGNGHPLLALEVLSVPGTRDKMANVNKWGAKRILILFTIVSANNSPLSSANSSLDRFSRKMSTKFGYKLNLSTHIYHSATFFGNNRSITYHNS